MKRDYRVYIDDILEALGKIERYTMGLNFEEFSQDSRTIKEDPPPLKPLIEEVLKKMDEEMK